jgi:RNA polymerase sigma factor (sigma-70 family)
MPATHFDRLVAGVRQALEPATKSDRELLNQFIQTRDTTAFETLVRRHGPQVLATCRKILPGTDADDAFQATFLALARDARRVRTAVAGWLVVVAHRIAVRLRAAERRRSAIESRHTGPAADERDPSWREACAVLHAELDKLPETFRRPLVFCYLRGLSRDEAARELGWSEGTLKGRLERGRTRLRARLKKCGLTLSAGLLAALAAPTAGAVPARLVRAAAGREPSPIASEVLRGLSSTSVASTWKAAGLLGVAAALIVAVWTMEPAKPVAAGQPDPPPVVKKDEPKSKPLVQAERVEVKGRVLGPDGKPVAGAKLHILDGAGRRAAPQESVNADGSFQFKLDPPPISFHGRYLVATADGFGCGWSLVSAVQTDHEHVLRLPEDVPIAGRVIDLEGKPVAGAKVRVLMIETTEPGKFDDFLKAWAGTKDEHEQSIYSLDQRLYENPGLDEIFIAKTDAEGRFTLRGVGKDRVPAVVIEAPGKAVQPVRVVTRPGFKDGPPGRKWRMTGPDGVFTVGPARLISGVVRDAKTQKPVAGVRVVAETYDESAFFRRWVKVEAKTDREGRYTLDRLPKLKQHIVLVDPPAGSSHLHYFAEVRDAEGFKPITLNVDLQPAVLVTGRVTDKATGQPIRARVWYRPLQENEFEDRTPGYTIEGHGPWGTNDDALTDADGCYRVHVLPGAGLLHVQAWDGTSAKLFPEARLDPKDEARGAYWAPFKDMPQLVMFKTGGRGGGYGPGQVNDYRLIDVKPGDSKFVADFPLSAGVSRRLKLVDPDGKPLTDVDCHGLAPMGDNETASSSEVTAIALDPGRPRKLMFRHYGRNLTAIVDLSGNEREPVEIKLVPRGAITGRVVDGDGKGVAGVSVEPSYQDHPIGTLLNTERMNRKPGDVVKTDANGRFTFDGIPVGIKLHLIAKRRGDDYWYTKEKMTLKPGQVLDIGDWKRE